MIIIVSGGCTVLYYAVGICVLFAKKLNINNNHNMFKPKSDNALSIGRCVIKSILLT